MQSAAIMISKGVWSSSNSLILVPEKKLFLKVKTKKKKDKERNTPFKRKSFWLRVSFKKFFILFDIQFEEINMLKVKIVHFILRELKISTKIEE